MKDFNFFSTIERLEDLKHVVEKLDNFETLYKKVRAVESFFNRFDRPMDLVILMEKLDKSCYILKEFLKMDEAADYLGVTKAHLYKMTAANRIPSYKPGGKQIYIHRDDLNRWIKSNKIISQEEMRNKELSYELLKGELADQKRRKGGRRQ